MDSQTQSKGLTSSQTEGTRSSRRQFLAQSSRVVAGSVLGGVALSRAYAGENNTIRLALVGCGGRGGGAAANALSSQTGPTKLVAMADVFEDRLTRSYNACGNSLASGSTCPRTGVLSGSTRIARRSTACGRAT